MKLTEEVYLVGGGDYGFNLTHRLDCHTYLVDGGGELALIDAGFGPGTDQILEIIREDGFDPRRHLDDRDHALPRRPRRRRSRAAAGHRRPCLGGGRGALHPGRRRRADRAELGEAVRLLSRGLRVGAVRGGRRVHGRDTDPGRQSRARARIDPGHCMGHYCVRMAGRDRTYMFSSDCVFWGGAIILQNVKDSTCEYAASQQDRGARVGRAAAGHHMISLRNGHRHAEAAANEFNRIGLPKDLLR